MPLPESSLVQSVLDASSLLRIGFALPCIKLSVNTLAMPTFTHSSRSARLLWVCPSSTMPPMWLIQDGCLGVVACCDTTLLPIKKLSAMPCELCCHLQGKDVFATRIYETSKPTFTLQQLRGRHCQHPDYFRIVKGVSSRDLLALELVVSECCGRLSHPCQLQL